MYASRLFQLLILAIAIVCVAQASWPDAPRHARRGLERRQTNGGGDNDDDAETTEVVSSEAPATTAETEATTAEETTAAEPTASSEPPAETTEAPPSTAETTENAPSTTGQQQPTSTNVPPETTAAPTRTTNQPADTATTAPPSESSSAPNDDNNEDGNQNSEEEQSTTSEPSRVVSTSIQVVTRTNGDGTRETFTSTTRTTSTPGLNGEASTESQGMSTNTRNTIIGVVVGVGGAILLGALAIVWWRLRSRKRQAEENDGLMSYDNGVGNGMEKSERGSSPPGTVGSHSQRNPFQSTLENYHQPTAVNPSSNF
jgi:outer membrane biosynthesis protein TonB